MDTPPAMDKKPLPRLPQLPVKSGPEGTVKDYGGKKYVGQCARKREVDRPDPGRKPMGGRGGRAGQRYVRPREKMGSKVELGVVHPESGSLYCAGGKKQNIAHLLDWWGPGHKPQSGGGGRVARVRRHSSYVPKYSKEHYLQANCQFVVDDCEDYSIYSANQDLLVEWKYVEEVRLHVSVAPSCPICLHAPTAAKVTRCGHIYCFPCVLHYLALSDKKWRKCPICYEPVTKDDLKSVVAICHKEFDIGEEVELQLMRRERESFLPVPAAAFSQEVIGQTPRLSCPTAATPYAKLLVASKEEVKSLIVAREQHELELQLEEEGDQPEACFLQEALALLRARQDSLSADTPLANPTFSPEEGMEMLSLSSPEEPSSNGSRTFFEEVLSPLSPVAVAEEASAVLDKPRSQGQEERPESTITVQDLDISQLQPLNSINPGGHVQRNIPKPTFYFYQARNGAHIYLHALNVQMLVHEYGALENCPHTLTAKVVEKETAAMTEELRMRLRYLRHLPVTCNFDVVEVALRAPIVSKATIALFQDQIDARKRKRNKRAREERKIEKRVQAEEDRMMGRSKGPTNIKIESLKQFPSFSEDFPARTNNEVNEAGVGGHEGAGNDLGTSPNSEALGSSAPNTIATGMSFAKMTREGQAKVPHSCSEPVDIGSGTWPSLGGSASRNDRPSQRSCGVSMAGRGWEGRDRVSESSCGNCAEDEEDMAAPPEYRHAFSNAMAKALDAATAVKKSAEDDDVVKDGWKRGRNKKKQKKVLLFSSGGLN